MNEDDEDLIKDVGKHALAMQARDEEDNFADLMFEATKETSRPPGPRNTQRGSAYALHAARVRKLAEIMSELTPFQERFVHIYVKKEWDSLSDIAKMAGSTAVTSQNLRNIAHQTLKLQKVKDAIGLLTYSKLEAEGVDRHEIVAMFRNVHYMAANDRKYKEASEAAEKLGMILGLFGGTKGGLSPHLAANMTKTEQKQLAELAEANKHSGGNVGVYGPSPAMDPLMLEEDLKSQMDIARKAKLN